MTHTDFEKKVKQNGTQRFISRICCLRRVSLDQIINVFPDGVKEEFQDESRQFTIFMPSAEAFLHLSYYEAMTLNAMGNTSEKYEVRYRLLWKYVWYDTKHEVEFTYD